MLGIIAVLLLPELAMKVQLLNCTGDESLKIPHEWYQEGEILTGGLMSQVHYLFPEISFNRHPSMESVDISYGSFQLVATDESRFPPFYRMAPNEALQYEGLVQLLLYFGWKWVGFVIADDKHGEHFIQIMEPKLSQNKICSEFTERVDRNFHFYHPSYMIDRCLRHITLFTEKTANAVIIHGENIVFMWLASVLLLHSFLQRMSFNNNAGDEIKLNEEGVLEAGFDIVNLVTFPNNSYINIPVGEIDPRAPPGKNFRIHPDKIQWHHEFTQLPPVSLCNDPCPLGKMKNKIEGQKFCCYACAQCPEKMISRQIAIKVQSQKCTGDEAIKISHEWYQEGELFIGGLMSQVHYLFPKIEFERHLSMESVEIPFYSDALMTYCITLDLLFKLHKIAPTIFVGLKRKLWESLEG
ncbi:hypothetical protein E2320_003450 [Naja naja]|nr:hypothetical protein E2320_003450 [Naja naja]